MCPTLWDVFDINESPRYIVDIYVYMIMYGKLIYAKRR